MELVQQAVEPAAATIPREVMELEGGEFGAPVMVVCPSCGGAITESNQGGFQHFRCHVGHAFSGKSMSIEQEAHVERALWSSLRAIEESAALLERLASSANGASRARYTEKAAERRAQVLVLRDLLFRAEKTPPAA